MLGTISSVIVANDKMCSQGLTLPFQFNDRSNFKWLFNKMQLVVEPMDVTNQFLWNNTIKCIAI